MAKLGFAACALGEKWKYWAAHHACDRHKRADKEIVDKRKEWLNATSRQG